ncbi:MAG: lysophospholipid acyltransferase family protein [Kofleriaceae bacterium]
MTELTTWERWMSGLAKYHSWEMVGADNVPRTGGVVFVGTHSLASYDLFIISASSRPLIGRQTYIVGDALLFKIPGVSSFLRENGFIHATRDELVQRLKDGDMIGIAPGGMKESLRSSRHRYEFDWSARKGFAWVSMHAGVPVVPTVCPRADHIYTVYENPVTPMLFKQFKVPLPLFSGRAFTPAPRPIKLVHLVGKPILPDVAPDQVREEDVARHHERIVEAVRELMAEALEMGDQAVGDDVRRFGDY